MMEEFQGVVEIDGSAYRVTGVLEVRERNGSKEWSGYLVPPTDANFASIVVVDGPHRLRLDDQRSGDVKFSNIDMDSAGTTVVDFDGASPLE
jgi:hypothetical protein